MGDTGFEIIQFHSGNLGFSSDGGANSGARAEDPANLTPDSDTDGALQQLLSIWPTLDTEARQTLVNEAYALSASNAAIGPSDNETHPERS